MKKIIILTIVFTLLGSFLHYRFKPKSLNEEIGVCIDEVIQKAESYEKTNLDTLIYSELDRVAKKMISKRNIRINDTDTVVLFEIIGDIRRISFIAVKENDEFRVVTSIDRNK